MSVCEDASWAKVEYRHRPHYGQELRALEERIKARNSPTNAPVVAPAMLEPESKNDVVAG
jgi:hypothetical protein